MESSIQRLKNINRAKAKLKDIFEQRRNVLLVHYSCESFVENTKGSHKVTSIAVRRLEDAQTQSFSIFQIAEELKIVNVEQEFEKIEKELLQKFFDYVKTHENYLWVHWNMRDISYGFAALEHRFKALGGTPVILRDDVKYDLPRILYSRFGKNYACHPRLESVMKKNKITDKNFLNGEEEATAFKSGDYLKLHQSNLRKVDVFDCILTRLEENDLLVDSTFFEIHGLSIQAIVKAIKDHWLISLIAIISIILGCVLKVMALLG